MAKKKKSIKVTRKKKKKPRTPRPQLYTGHIGDLGKILFNLERRIVELEKLKKGLENWAVGLEV